MKKLLPFGLALIAPAFIANAQTTAVESQEVQNIAVSSISDNGEWMVGEAGEGNLMIINLTNNRSWTYRGSGADNEEGYITGSTREVSDDGTVVGENNSIPSYWQNGKWNQLKGWVRDNSGYVYAVVGAITPDGSMIVGGLGKGGGQVTGDEDWQMTYPCVWNRNDDGTYGDPVWLPNPSKDIFDRIPQYVHCIAVSQDGKTIGAMMRDGFGGFCQPYVFTLGDNGEWSYKALGMNLINPNNIPIVPFPGEWNGDGVPNDFERYMTEEEYAQFESQWYAWYMEQERLGYTEEEIAIRELHFAMEFMSGERKAAYEAKVERWENGYLAWDKAWKKYEQCVIELFNTGFTFEFNNIFLSPDGKYIYSSVKPQNADSYIPVRIDVQTGEYQLYPNNNNILVSGVTSDYSILGHAYDQDTDLYTMAYIFPQGQTTPVSFVDYFQGLPDSGIYEWVEEHIYREVVVGITGTGAEQYGDEWCFGKPVSTPDLGIIAFSSSTLYWAAPPQGNTNGYITFIVSTGEDSGVESVSAAGEASFKVLPGQNLEFNGDFAEVSIYDLSGVCVFKAANPSGVVSTGISKGIYIVKASTVSGETVTEKVLL